MKLLNRAGLVTAALVGAGGAAATPPDGPIDRIRACLSLSDEQRAPCLEAASRSLVSAVDAGTVVVRTAPPPRDAGERFGLAHAQAPVEAEPHARAADPRVDRLSGHLTSVAPLPNGRWQFALDGKSIWKTLEAGVVFLPRVGDEVTIRRGTLGSLRAAFRGQAPLLVARQH